MAGIKKNSKQTLFNRANSLITKAVALRVIFLNKTVCVIISYQKTFIYNSTCCNMYFWWKLARNENNVIFERANSFILKTPVGATEKFYKAKISFRKIPTESLNKFDWHKLTNGILIRPTHLYPKNIQQKFSYNSLQQKRFYNSGGYV